MNENVGASFGLSVLMVLFFAIILYQPDPPGHPGQHEHATPPTASAEPVEALAPEAPVVIKPVANRDPERAAPVARPVSRPTSRRAIHRPSAGFTKVRACETLTDVARRIYGDSDALKTLWAANRDLLDRVDAPVAPGSILRTP